MAGVKSILHIFTLKYVLYFWRFPTNPSSIQLEFEHCFAKVALLLNGLLCSIGIFLSHGYSNTELSTSSN